MQISALEGQRVAIWGFGREGQAALDSIRRRLPKLPMTLFCSAAEAVGAHARLDDGLDIRTHVDEAELTRFDVVIKSPGISPYAAPAAGAALHGTQFIGGSALWFAEHVAKLAPGRVICVTGSKGKSTVSALIAHVLRAAGKRTALAGNIGLPLLSLLDASPEPAYWVVELSSYQAGDALRPNVAVVLNLFPEHLDWHGSEQRYYADKLALISHGNPRALVLNAGDARLRAIATAAGACTWFDNAAGWHLHADKVFRGEQQVLDLRGLPLPGRHNGLNLCAALAAIEALGLDAVALAPHAASFAPLPHRLQRLGVRDGIEYINDSISTTPHASMAALDCFADRRVAIIVGGFDRGLERVCRARAHQTAAAGDYPGPERPAYPRSDRADGARRAAAIAGRRRPHRRGRQGAACARQRRPAAAVAGCTEFSALYRLHRARPAFRHPRGFRRQRHRRHCRAGCRLKDARYVNACATNVLAAAPCEAPILGSFMEGRLCVC